MLRPEQLPTHQRQTDRPAVRPFFILSPRSGNNRLARVRVISGLSRLLDDENTLSQIDLTLYLWTSNFVTLAQSRPANQVCPYLVVLSGVRFRRCLGERRTRLFSVFDVWRLALSLCLSNGPAAPAAAIQGVD